MPKKGQKFSRVVWTESEWFLVVSRYVELRDKDRDISITGALSEAQHVLPPRRWRTLIGLGSSSVATLRDFEARIRSGWVPEGWTPPKAIGNNTPPPTPEPAPSPVAEVMTPLPTNIHKIEATFPDSKGRIFWTTREWKRVALRAETLLKADPSRTLARTIFEAQLPPTLPLDRCRLLSSFHSASTAVLRRKYEEGLKGAWTLPAKERAALMGQEQSYAEHEAKTRAGLEAEQAAAPTAAAEPAPAFEVPQFPGQCEYGGPPTAAPAPVPAADPLAARIAVILAESSARIAAETRSYVARELDAALDTMVGGIVAGLRAQVHNMIAAELGPLEATPAPLPEPPTPTPTVPPAPQEPPRVKVDIVGLSGNSLGEVRNAAENMGLQARFIDAAHAKGTWSPAPNVILATKFISHTAQERAKRSGANVLFAHAGPQSIVGMMETLVPHPVGLQ